MDRMQTKIGADDTTEPFYVDIEYDTKKQSLVLTSGDQEIKFRASDIPKFTKIVSAILGRHLGVG